MPKTRKMKEQRATTLLSLGKAARMAEIICGMPGTRLRARSGRSARTERMADVLPKVSGKRIGSHASETTTKSSWHHASRRYVPS